MNEIQYEDLFNPCLYDKNVLAAHKTTGLRPRDTDMHDHPRKTLENRVGSVSLNSDYDRKSSPKYSQRQGQYPSSLSIQSRVDPMNTTSRSLNKPLYQLPKYK